MKYILTVGVRARFAMDAINEMWEAFSRKREEDPGEIYFQVGKFTDNRGGIPHSQNVLVKIDEHPDGKVATMLLSGEF